MSVTTQPTFVVGRRRVVLGGSYLTNNSHVNYDRDARSGQFVMLGQATESARSLVIVLNWFAELRDRMGGR